MACVYPDARTPLELWENVLAQRRAFRRIPRERLRVEDYWSTDPGAPTPDKMDLLTVVEHEMGHELGLPDVDPTSNPTDLMASTLATGVRRQPSTQDVDAVFAHLSKTPLMVMGSM